MRDILIPYYASRDGEELRYCLRSIEKNLPHDRIFIVGGRHDWFNENIIHIPKPQSLHKMLDSELNIYTGLRSDLSDEFIFMNDDFFCLERIEETQDGFIPPYHLGKLSDCLKERLERHGRSGYTVAITNTINLLRKLGIPEPLNYSAHIPMVMKKAERMAVHQVVMPHLKVGQQILVRAVYGNMFIGDGIEVEDVKIADVEETIHGGPEQYVSTSNKSFSDGMIGDFIHTLFPEPSRYEN